MSLPYRLYGGMQVKELDQLAIEQYNIPGIELMGRAGASLFKVCRQAFPLAKQFGIVCGTGNNGGDGYLLGSMLLEDGLKAQIYTPDPDKALSPTAELAKQAYLSAGGTIEALPNRLEHVDVVVDALLGTGINGQLKPEYKQAIALINQTEKPVVSVDLPSGIDGDSGAVIGSAVNADITVTFVGLKYALLTGPAVNYSGFVIYDALGIPEEVFAAKPWQGEIIQLEQALTKLSPRAKAAHKGQFGHALLVGAGNPGLAGAIGLSALGCLNSGCGLTSALVHPQSWPRLAQAPMELMCHLDDQNEQIDALWQKASVVAIGPGLGLGSWAQAKWQQACKQAKPMVVDADALKLLAKEGQSNPNWVLTPHPGEAAELLGQSVQAIEANRLASAREIQKRYGGVVVLKGAGSLVVSESDCFYLCNLGNPGMACAGMGDILSGLLAGLMAQGMSGLDAAKLAVIIHAQAGDLEQTMGERGMLASDLSLHIRSLLNPPEKQDTDVSQFFNFE